MPLSKSQLGEIEKLLDHQYVNLLEEVREELTRNGDAEYLEIVGRGGVDSGDEAVRGALADLNAALFDRHIREIREIEAARERLREGIFGSCEDCDDDIRFERLQARPTARRCVECQEQHDRTTSYEPTPKI